MKILIVGAGIAGLSLAAHLQKRGIEVKIVEKAKEFKHVGFMLGLWGTGLDTLDEFRVKEKIENEGYLSSVVVIRNKKGTVIKKLNFNHLIKDRGPVTLIHRADLHKILLNLNKNTPMQLGTTVTSISQSENEVEVILSDGKKESYDLLVGADGIHSQVRSKIFSIDPIYGGMHAWIYMMQSSTDMPKNVSEMWVGERFFGAFPHKKDTLCAIFAKRMGEFDYQGEDHISYLRNNFSDFGWIVPEVLSSMNANRAVFHDTWDEIQLKTWYKGRVVLIGDAAHATLPVVGMGACMAFEDAALLASSLTTQSVEEALESFQKQREKHVNLVQKQSEIIEKIKNIDGVISIFIRDTILKFVPSGLIVKDFEYMLAE